MNIDNVVMYHEISHETSKRREFIKLIVEKTYLPIPKFDRKQNTSRYHDRRELVKLCRNLNKILVSL